MEASIYVNTTFKLARAAASGAALPSVAPVLQSHLLLNIYFFADGSGPALLDESATFRVALKDVNAPSGPVLALLSSPTNTASDHYEFEWSQVDSAALRTLLGDSNAAVPAILEIEWTIGSVVERVDIPVAIANAYIRTSDTAPDFLQFLATITSLGYFEFRDTAGNYWNIGLNSGRAPTT